MERTRLRMQVAALERALETSERQRQSVIDRYERLLAERDDSHRDLSTGERRTGSSLRRLLTGWY
ncbi:hypothetical protein GS429_12225 [Natronorubrum sp. JWXQ-INN-674]|uniref:Uncharacterized protein n=1 Tax=Natronorubrum halalkaliphilum TaxID=2691917 RepID=A0A6B0VMW9_9EURY|nr:hypothetical protein [Natronorubrum halalkaliphilum]